MDKSTKWLVITMWLMAIAMLGVTAWLYLYEENYTFIVEAKCDATTQNCFHRDCSSDNANCPPNNLKDYKLYRVSAKNFITCVSDTCASECENGSITCNKVECNLNTGDSCTSNPEQSAQ